MKGTSLEVGRRSPVNAALLFVLHQFIGTFGIAFVAYLAGSSLFELVGHLGMPVRMSYLHRMLTETPYYPIQILLGLYFGWLVGSRLHDHLMVWVWVIPLIVLCYAVVTYFTPIPEWTSVLARFGPGHESRLSHYFGWGCHPSAHCFDQLVITLPLYDSLAYSLGGWLALTFGAN